MRVALYVRVSTEEQFTEGYSIAAQRDRLNSYCLSQEWDVVETYVEEGQSAKDTDRTQLKQLIADAENGAFDIVLVYKLDRLTRSVLDLYTLLQTFERCNVKFKSATELYDTTTAMGKLFITLVAALAQWERENLAERVRLGMEQMVMEGKRPGGPIPFGYDSSGKVIEDEARVIREVRSLYMNGLGFRLVAKTLNQCGKLRRGQEWSSYTVYYVLDNPYYAGKLRWGSKKTDGKYSNRKKEEAVECIIQDSDHERIFTWEEYVEHTARMKRRSFHGYSKVNQYWFSSVLKCGKCGAAMTGRVKKNKLKNGGESVFITYICANKQTKGACKMPLFRQELVEKLLIEWIASVKLEYDRVAVNMGTSDDGGRRTQLTEELTALRKELQKIKERKSKWQNLLLDEMITKEEYTERITEERQKEESIALMITDKESELASQSNTDDTLQTLFGLEDYWGSLNDKQKSDLIQTVFRSIEIDTPIESSYGLARKGHFIPANIKSVQYA